MRPTYTIALLASILFDHVVAAPQISDWNPYERINKNDSVGLTLILPSHTHLVSQSQTQALLIVDHQVGLLSIARDWDTTLFFSNIRGHAAIGKLFDIPVVITTSAETGPNGPVPKEILDMYPEVEVVQRKGEIK